MHCFTELPSSPNPELQTESSSENEETKLEWFKPATSEELSSFLESEDWLRYGLRLSKLTINSCLYMLAVQNS